MLVCLPLGMLAVLFCVHDGCVKNGILTGCLRGVNLFHHPAAGGNVHVSLHSGDASDKIYLHMFPCLLVMGHAVPSVACGEHYTLRRVVPPSLLESAVTAAQPLRPLGIARDVYRLDGPPPPCVSPSNGGAHDAGSFARGVSGGVAAPSPPRGRNGLVVSWCAGGRPQLLRPSAGAAHDRRPVFVHERPHVAKAAGHSRLHFPQR